jgi:hypothetical protein
MLMKGNKASKFFQNPKNKLDRTYPVQITERRTAPEQVFRQKEVFLRGLDHGLGYFVVANEIFGTQKAIPQDEFNQWHPLWQKEVMQFDREWEEAFSEATDDQERAFAEFVIKKVSRKTEFIVDGLGKLEVGFEEDCINYLLIGK